MRRSAVLLFTALLLMIGCVYCATPSSQCVHFPEEDCSPELSWCDYYNISAAKYGVLCCNFNSPYLLKTEVKLRLNGDVKALHIRNLTLEKLDIQFFNYLALESLESLAITDGNIKYITHQLDVNTSCLNFSHNGLVELDPYVLKNSTSLQYLDLSNNSLVVLPELSAPNITMNILGNTNMTCDSVINASRKIGAQFEKSGESCCLHQTNIGWFNSSVSISLVELEAKEQIDEMCPDKCNCRVNRLNIVPDKPPTYTAEVHCFDAGLTELPASLPNNTVLLNVTSNHISDLYQFVSNPQYKEITTLIADDNDISSILNLEGSDFIEKFSLFSIKRNKLKTIPTYIFSNTFDRNLMNVANMGGNMLHCDCSTVKVVKVWLMTNTKYILDYREVMCDNYQLRVIDLDTNEVCVHQPEWKDYLNYIIAFEVAMLVCLVLKVSYDYWVFKTAGYLPWPANKMPKLPCDCVCEA